MKKRKKKNNQKQLVIGLIAVATIFIIALLIFSTKPSEVEKELNKEGYTTTQEDAFYKKIVTNNTLDEFYQDVASNKDSAYEEYYFAKESLNFIELKILNQSSVLSTLNITADVRTDKIVYNYELSNNNSHLLLEGNSDENYDCKIIVNKNVDDSVTQECCNLIMQEISTFLTRKDELLQNEKVQELVNSPIKEYVEE